MSMMRTSYMATHRDEHLNKLIEVFGEVSAELDAMGVNVKASSNANGVHA
jgi:hypothetical protein